MFGRENKLIAIVHVGMSILMAYMLLVGCKVKALGGNER